MNERARATMCNKLANQPTNHLKHQQEDCARSFDVGWLVEQEMVTSKLQPRPSHKTQDLPLAVASWLLVMAAAAGGEVVVAVTGALVLASPLADLLFLDFFDFLTRKGAAGADVGGSTSTTTTFETLFSLFSTETSGSGTAVMVVGSISISTTILD